MPDRRPPTIWRNQGGPRGKGPPPAIGWKTEINNPPIEHPPAAIGWKPGIVNTCDDPPPGAGWRPEVHGAPSWNAPYPPPPRGGEGVSGEPSSRPRPPPGAATVYPYPPWNYDDSPQRPKRQKGEKSNKKGSKSLPTSPMKRSATASGADSWKQQQQQQRPQTYEEAGNIGNNIDPGGMKRTTSFPNARDSSSTSPGPRRPGDKKTRHHKGNVYVEVDVDQVEKETVL